MAATLSSRRQSSEQAALTLRPPIAWSVQVKGTIGSSTTGRRVRAWRIEDVVRVAAGDETSELRAGDERLPAPSARFQSNEIAWSRNPDNTLHPGNYAVLAKNVKKRTFPGLGPPYGCKLCLMFPITLQSMLPFPSRARASVRRASHCFQERFASESRRPLPAGFGERRAAARQGPKLAGAQFRAFRRPSTAIWETRSYRHRKRARPTARRS